MTDQTLKRKGGRPPLPPAPQNAAETRALIATEVVKTNPSVRRLQQLYRLLKAFVQAEEQTTADIKARALEETARVQRESLELKNAEYQRRMMMNGSLGVQTLQRQLARIRELEETVARLETELGREKGTACLIQD